MLEPKKYPNRWEDMFTMEQGQQKSRDCPQCGRPMRIRHRRSDGKPFWGCTGFSTEECRYAEDYQGDESAKNSSAAVENNPVETKPVETKPCPQCGRPMRMRHRRSDGKPFWGCTGFSTEECRYAEDYQGDESAKNSSAAVENNPVETKPVETKPCPQCGRLMRMRHRRSDGKPFWGCTGFSTEECRYAEDYIEGSH